MASLNLTISFFDHRKVKRLVHLLGKGSEILPLRLWVLTAKDFDDGRLTGISVQEIEGECLWWGRKGRMCEIMLADETRFLEAQNDGSFIVHGLDGRWIDEQGHIRAFKERGRKAAKKRWGDATSNATSITTSNALTVHSIAEQNPVLGPAPPIDPGGDTLDSLVHSYVNAHPRLIWDRKLHANMCKLVNVVGWERAKKLVDSSVNFEFPVSYALGIAEREYRQNVAKNGHPKAETAEDLRKKSWSPYGS